MNPVWTTHHCRVVMLLISCVWLMLWMVSLEMNKRESKRAPRSYLVQWLLTLFDKKCANQCQWGTALVATADSQARHYETIINNDWRSEVVRNSLAAWKAAENIWHPSTTIIPDGGTVMVPHPAWQIANCTKGVTGDHWWQPVLVEKTWWFMMRRGQWATAGTNHPKSLVLIPYIG